MVLGCSLGRNDMRGRRGRRALTPIGMGIATNALMPGMILNTIFVRDKTGCICWRLGGMAEIRIGCLGVGPTQSRCCERVRKHEKARKERILSTLRRGFASKRRLCVDLYTIFLVTCMLVMHSQWSAGPPVAARPPSVEERSSRMAASACDTQRTECSHTDWS